MQYGKFAIACQLKFSLAIAGWLELAVLICSRILPRGEMPDFMLACRYAEMIDLNNQLRHNAHNIFKLLG
jgi:hypothetical protein